MESKQPAVESLPIEAVAAKGEAALRRVLESGAPLEIAVEGHRALVIMRTEDRDREAAMLEAAREAAILTERFYASPESDPVRSWDDAVADLRARYGI